MDTGKKQLVLNKGQERYIFRYQPGQEAQLLEALVSAANDPRLDFDWFDAAVLSFKLTDSLMQQANQILYKDLTDPLNSASCPQTDES